MSSRSKRSPAPRANARNRAKFHINAPSRSTIRCHRKINFRAGSWSDFAAGDCSGGAGHRVRSRDPN
jgi:hypothetical protein